ncbi:Vegetative incompatibility protein HET-E-1 [Colletotrichum siamense]|nr:Vegetative incompatibility protein HET-E-1 [Colletotrichum siamense]
MCQTAAVKRKKGYRKLLSCCALALEYGLKYVWIDTCCIDKSSSAELSEAINSMYSWYEASRICFAYMEDVPPGDGITVDGSAFRTSVWFTRGWTLQELIAPNEVIFYDCDWGQELLVASLPCPNFSRPSREYKQRSSSIGKVRIPQA